MSGIKRARAARVNAKLKATGPVVRRGRRRARPEDDEDGGGGVGGASAAAVISTSLTAAARGGSGEDRGTQNDSTTTFTIPSKTWPKNARGAPAY